MAEVKPEADVLEQQLALDDDDVEETEPTIRADVPEADALEQSRPATLEDEDELPSEGADVPEADALEQSRAVPPDDEQ